MVTEIRWMKRFYWFASLVISLPALASVQQPSPDLVVYTYDSLAASGGIGPEIFPLFEKKCRCKVKALPAGDAGQILSRLQLDAERGRSGAQVVLGIDQQTWERAKPWLQGWQGWVPHGFDTITDEAKLGSGFLPFDYGFFSLIADRGSLAALNLKPPSRFRDLLKPEWKRRILLEDPRTSTPGMGFFLFSVQLLGKPEAWEFWSRFRGQWLTLTPGWDEAYSLFMKKEAPLVWSYTTSQAYHEEHGDGLGDQKRYRAVLFDEGQPMQVEGAALVKGSFKSTKQLKLAREFLEFLISPEIQNLVPKKNWMFPALKTAVLPASFRNLPRPKRIITGRFEANQQEEDLRYWNRLVARPVEGDGSR